MTGVIGQDILRKESWEKVTGRARYVRDETNPAMLHGHIVTSPHAHAEIIHVDASKALALSEVLAVITGEDAPQPYGPLLEDRTVLALGKVRHYGEPVAVVVGVTEAAAKLGASLVQVQYRPLPFVMTATQAVAHGAPLVHESMVRYSRVSPAITPEEGTNVAHRWRIRKGDLAAGWGQAAAMVEAEYHVPHADHAAMETRCAKAEIGRDGTVKISTATQAPFSVKKALSKHFGVDGARVSIRAPLVGGAFGGKTAPQLELLAYLASKAVGGRPVRVANTREQDISTSPGKLSLDAKVRLGAGQNGRLVAAEILFLLDCGAYSDISINMAKAIAVDCTGPYRVDNVWCDSAVVYTNNPYAASFRGFGHASQAFVMERTMDKLAAKLGIDPLEFRYRNAATPGDTSPTHDRLTASSMGSLRSCIDGVKELTRWDGGRPTRGAEGRVRAMGCSCFWKAPNSPTDASSSVILTFDEFGNANLACGIVEFGNGTKTVLAQIVAERLRIETDKVNVIMEVATDMSPHHWKTVASMSVYMAGNAALRATEDAIRQLKGIGSTVLRCPPDALDVGEGRVYVRSDPAMGIDISLLANGYKYSGGNAVGDQVIGHGTFIMPHLTELDPQTGAGRSAPTRTVCAQVAEVEYDPSSHRFAVLRTATVADVGKVMNPLGARGIVMGGMAMGIGLATREELVTGPGGDIKNESFRTYKLLRYGEQPEYLVGFVETPQLDGPYGARGVGEHGVIGIPAAVANALSAATGLEVDQIPVTPETLWRLATEGGPRG